MSLNLTVREWSLFLLVLPTFRKRSNLMVAILIFTICCIVCLLVIEVFLVLKPLFMETFLVFLLILLTLLTLSILPNLRLESFRWTRGLVIITIIVLGWLLFCLALWLASIPIRMILVILHL